MIARLSPGYPPQRPGARGPLAGGAAWIRDGWAVRLNTSHRHHRKVGVRSASGYGRRQRADRVKQRTEQPMESMTDDRRSWRESSHTHTHTRARTRKHSRHTRATKRRSPKTPDHKHSHRASLSEPRSKDKRSLSTKTLNKDFAPGAKKSHTKRGDQSPCFLEGAGRAC